MIALGSDHGGYELKLEIKKYLDEKGIEYKDYGCDSLESVDYPVYAKKVAHAILDGECEKGILFCGTGIGISIAANKIKGVLCGMGYGDLVTQYMRQHNDANMISFGAKFMSTSDVLRRVDIFIHARFEGGRHEKRVETIKNEEK